MGNDLRQGSQGLAPNYNYDIKRYPHNWRALNALCRHAGHTSVVNASFRFFGTSPLDGAISPAYVEAVTCPTNAQSLSDCALVPNADFGMTIPAGVDCFPELTAGRWQYRLHRTDVSGKASKGIAQMRIGDDGQWGSIMTPSTNNFGLWDAFCNMVGYLRGSTKITRNLTPYNGGDSGSDAFSPRYLTNTYCNYNSLPSVDVWSFPLLIHHGAWWHACWWVVPPRSRAGCRQRSEGCDVASQ